MINCLWKSLEGAFTLMAFWPLQMILLLCCSAREMYASIIEKADWRREVRCKCIPTFNKTTLSFLFISGLSRTFWKKLIILLTSMSLVEGPFEGTWFIGNKWLYVLKWNILINLTYLCWSFLQNLFTDHEKCQFELDIALYLMFGKSQIDL